MSKTIFGRLLFASLTVLLLSFTMTGAILYGFMGSYLVNEKATQLENVATQVAEMTVALQIENKGIIYDNAYRNNLNAVASFSGAHVLIVNKSGELFAADKSLAGVSRIKKELTGDVLAGNQVQLAGNLGGIYASNVFTVGYPIRYNEEVVGGVFISVTAPQMDKMRSSITNAFILTGCVVFLFAFMIMYALSRRLTRPIKSMNHAAQRVASGRFDSRVDITSEDEIGQLAATFNYMADSLSRLDKMQSSFIANVSHELRTPMTSISGFIDSILDNTIPPEKQAEYLKIVSVEIRRLARLVNDMLDISKMSLGEYKPDIKSFDINELIRLSIIKFEQSIEEKALHIDVAFEQDPLQVLADHDAISRVLTNLMDNAIKFSDQGGELNIAVGVRGKKAEISLANTGMGIEPDDLTHIWERFYKSDKSRSSDKSGAGLGLYMVKNILVHHGQTIQAESRELRQKDDGEPIYLTTFTFTLELS